MRYREILAGSWKILRSHPHLWFFGALALLGSCAGSWVTNFPLTPLNLGGGAEVAAQNTKTITNAVVWVVNHLVISITVVFTLALVTTVFWFVSVFNGAAMIWSAGRLAGGERSNRQDARKAAHGNYWKFAALSLILDCVVILGVGFAVMPLVLAMSQASSAVEFAGTGLPEQIGEFVAFMLVRSAKHPAVIATGFLFTTVSFMLFAAVGVLRELSGRALLLDGMPVVTSLITGAKLIGRSPGRVLLTWMTGLCAAAVLGAAAVLVLLAVVAPLFYVFPEASSLASGNVGAILPAIPVLLAAAAAALVLGGIISAFFAAYWGYAYRRLSTYLVSLESVTTTLEEPAT